MVAASGRSEQPVVQRAPFDIGGDRRSRDYERDDRERASAAAQRGRFYFRRGPGLDLGSSKRRMHRLASSVTCVVHDIAADALL